MRNATMTMVVRKSERDAINELAHNNGLTKKALIRSRFPEVFNNPEDMGNRPNGLKTDDQEY